MNQLKKLKKVFIEPLNDSKAKEMRNEYEKECLTSKNGAIFFLCARGRLIEGIDFKDE